MSKMPAKKKSCFQITSVTTAQVASSITEDTESLDDPDESRTEDVSSEIFDVSRATDYGPEDVCERSSSEETLNNVGDAETPGTVSPNLLLDGQVAAAAVAAASGGIQPPPSAVPVANGGAVPRSTVMPSATASQACSIATGGSSVQPAAGPPAMPLTAAAACSSRFRVIKLDHGTGEPFRRGRWTCMEYYDRDSDGGAVLARTGDCIRHNSTFEQAVQDRDSGLGATGSSLIVSGVATSAHGPDSLADSSVTAVSQLLQPEKINQPSPQQPNFIIGQQPHSSAQPIYSGATVAGQQVMGPLLQTQVNAQSMGQAGPNGKGLPTTNVAIAQPGLPMPQQQVQQANVPVAQSQQFAYSQSQMTPVHMVSAQTPGQPEYIQHMTVMQSQGATQQAASGSVTGTGASSLPAAQVVGQNPSPLAPVMGVASPAGETIGQGSGLMQGGLTTPLQTVISQPGGVVQGLGHAGAVQQKSMTQQQMGGSSQVAGTPHNIVSGVQNVPVAVPGTTVPNVSTTSVSMPNASVTLVQSQLTSHTTVSRSSSVVQQHIGLPLMQGTSSVPTNLPQSNIGQFQTQPLGQIDDSRRKSEPLPQPPLSLVAENKLHVKPPIPDSLTNPLNLPATTPMNSLASTVFGIAIPVDGDEDSASGGSVVAIDNKIEQAMDLVKSHLMYAVREEVEVLKEQIKELVERNSLLERENALLKSLSNNDQLSQLSTQQANPSSTSQQQTVIAQPPQPTQPPQQPNVSSA
ncbi:TSC22 domain family protein 2 isoform X1 [Thamnophis elegans]|uniref:TSC22 domain family protein 2 isoform X1 n=1 Tax=Thamnophis elegans TaxID=35005 RepID=UPI001376E401|nr:TSC22 domain family protein 2 isoform X1 [Thamnophis elegans]